MKIKFNTILSHFIAGTNINTEYDCIKNNLGVQYVINQDLFGFISTLDYRCIEFIEDNPKGAKDCLSNLIGQKMKHLSIENIVADHWQQFKKEELGRTLPEEFEFFMSDYTLESLRTWDYPVISRNKNDTFKNKIKITVVEE